MGATTVAAALSDFQAISQTVGTLKGGTVGADNLADEVKRLWLINRLQRL